MPDDNLIPHLYRTEYRKLVAVLCRRFGFDQIETAEDIASDTFLAASQFWGLNGVPQNPTAWLYAVAKNKATNHLRRNSLFDSAIVPELQNQPPITGDFEIDLSPQNINDSQLRMMFAVCHPSISPEAQIGLALRILCGFSIEEIADAFLTNKDTINKRLFRAKERLRELKIDLELPGGPDVDRRLEPVLTAIYLLFNEGYYSTSQSPTLRKDLCYEALRLCNLLVDNPFTDRPEVNALLALMCFHASRFAARVDHNGEMVLYDDQDPGLWDAELISRGGYFLNRSASGNRVSRFHLEAAIAFWHTQKADTQEKWENILQLYNRLLQLAYSPIAALNRTYALSRANGKLEAIAEAEKLQLTGNHFYYTLLGELYTGIDTGKAVSHFQRAMSLAKTKADKQSIQKKINTLCHENAPRT